MNRKILCITILLWTLPSLGVIEYKIKLHNSEPSQDLYFLGDNHSISDEEKNAMQLETLKTSILAHEAQEKPLDIFIENPSTLSKKTQKEHGVLLSLYEHVKETDLSYVSIEDIEIRKIANAAYFLLGTSFNPCFDYSQPFNNDYRPLDSIRFKDIYHEYAHVTEAIKSWAPLRADPMLCNEINDLVELSTDNERSFKCNLRKLNISENDMIFPIANTLSQKEETFLKKETLAGDLYNSFAPLLEAHTLQKISSNSSPTIWTVAGTYHIKSIQSSLRNLPTITAHSNDILTSI